MNRTSFRAVCFATILAACTLTGCERSLLAVRESGNDHYKRGEYDSALQDYQEYMQRSPGRPEVYHMLGKTYLALGQTGMARENLLIAHSLRLNDDEVFADTCDGLYADKQYEELNRILRTRTIDRGRMFDYLLLAQYAEKQGDMDEAQRALLTAARTDGGQSIQPQLALAKIYAKVGDRQRAVERLRMAYFIDSRNGEVLQLAQEMGEIVGHSFALMPTERQAPPERTSAVPTETPKPQE